MSRGSYVSTVCSAICKQPERRNSRLSGREASHRRLPMMSQDGQPTDRGESGPRVDSLRGHGRRPLFELLLEVAHNHERRLVWPFDAV